MPRATIYTRVSTDDQAERGTSLGEQLAACQAKARQIGAEIVSVHTDAGVSGALYKTREALQRALKEIDAKTADTMIVYDVSRLSRDREHQAVIRKRIERAGAKLVFTEQTFDDSVEGEFMFNITGDVADYYRKQLKRKFALGKRRRAEEGRQPSTASSPYGYHLVTKPDVLRGEYTVDLIGRYVIVEEEARWIRTVFQMCADGSPLRCLVEHLIAEKAPLPPRAKTWYRGTVRRFLTNPVYRGAGRFGVTRWMHDESRLDRGYVTTRFSQNRPPEEWISIPAPAIVSEELWRACNRRLSDNVERLSGTPKHRYMLTGLLHCSICGAPMHGVLSSNYNGGPAVQRHYRYYRCYPSCAVKAARRRTLDAASTSDAISASSVKGGECRTVHAGPTDDMAGMSSPTAGKCRSFRVEHTDDAVIRLLTEIARRPELAERALQLYRDGLTANPHQAELRKLDAELKSLERREDATIRAQVQAIEHDRPAAGYDRLLGEIASRRRDITERAEALRRTIAPSEADCRKLDPPARLASMVEGVLRSEMPNDQKHALLSTVVRSIWLTVDGIVMDVGSHRSPLVYRYTLRNSKLHVACFSQD